MSDAPPDQERKRRGSQKIQRQLDEALDASFPASDPVSIVHGAGGTRAARQARPAPQSLKGLRGAGHGAVSSRAEPA